MFWKAVIATLVMVLIAPSDLARNAASARTPASGVLALRSHDTCEVTAFLRSNPANTRDAVVFVESHVKTYASGGAAQRAMEHQLKYFLADGGADHSEDREAKKLGALMGTVGAFGQNPPMLLGLGMYRKDATVHTIFAVKTALTGLPMNVSDDVFALIEKAQKHRSGTLKDRLLTSRDLGAGWSTDEPVLLQCK